MIIKLTSNYLHPQFIMKYQNVSMSLIIHLIKNGEIYKCFHKDITGKFIKISLTDDDFAKIHFETVKLCVKIMTGSYLKKMCLAPVHDDQKFRIKVMMTSNKSNIKISTENDSIVPSIVQNIVNEPIIVQKKVKTTIEQQKYHDYMKLIASKYPITTINDEKVNEDLMNEMVDDVNDYNNTRCI